jgi:hypothetical protein
MDRGFFLTLQAMRRQLAAMPCDYDQIGLIHGGSRKPFPGDRVWSVLSKGAKALVVGLAPVGLILSPFASAGFATRAQPSRRVVMAFSIARGEGGTYRPDTVTVR